MSVVCECLKYADILNEIIDCCNLISSDKRFKRNKDLALVVLCRYVFGKGLNGCYSTYKVQPMLCFNFIFTTLPSFTWCEWIFHSMCGKVASDETTTINSQKPQPHIHLHNVKYESAVIFMEPCYGCSIILREPCSGGGYIFRNHQLF